MKIKWSQFRVRLALGTATILAGCATRPDPPMMTEIGQPVPPETAKAIHIQQRSAEARHDRLAVYLIDHPSCTTELQARLSEGAVFKGMTKEQLIVVLGNPWTETVHPGAAGDREHWVYLADASLRQDDFYFDNGLLKTWQLSK